MQLVKSILLVLFCNYSFSIVLPISLGKLKGKQIGEYHSFKRIPFSKPPLGKLRFQKPEPPENWEDTLDAQEYGPACMSNSTISKSIPKWVDEDCLHVNIFTSSKCLKSKDCAVVVYIHGGDILFDSAVMFNDTYIFNSFVRNDVIVVIPAFRLGIFSHFTIRDQSIAPTNVAIYDMLQALEFTKSEIHNFGGNNKQVTLFGHSYGGTVVSMLAFSTEINKDLSLFQQAIPMSSHQYFETVEQHMEKTQKFAEVANCLPSGEMTENEKDTYTMKCLQGKSASELLRIQRALEETGYPTLATIAWREPLFPKGKISELMDSPKKMPMLTGCTRIEFDHEPEPIILPVVFGLDNPTECDAKYRKDVEEGRYDRGNHTDKTQVILVPTMMRVKKLREKGIPAYLYEYTYPKHAKHTDDLFYLMGVHPFEEDENEIHLKKVYQEMFTNFVKFGHPGIGFEIMDLNSSSYFDVYWNEITGQRPQMREHFEKKVMDYWLIEMMEYDKNLTEQKKLFGGKSFRAFSGPTILNQSSHSFLTILIVFIVFLTGLAFGKYFSSSKREMYIKLEGNEY